MQGEWVQSLGRDPTCLAVQPRKILKCYFLRPVKPICVSLVYPFHLRAFIIIIYILLTSSIVFILFTLFVILMVFPCFWPLFYDVLIFCKCLFRCLLPFSILFFLWSIHMGVKIKSLRGWSGPAPWLILFLLN